ncbi:MAG: helix-turn-helix transcriptional regulator [Kofleriaceae bacterium]
MYVDRQVLRRLCRARELLLDEPAASIPMIAAAIEMSPFHFIRRFEAIFGATPHQHRIAARLERARHLLAADRSVTEVCFEVGFSSLGTFSDTFTRRVGETPSSYRRRFVQSPGIAVVPGCLGLMTLLPGRNFREA